VADKADALPAAKLPKLHSETLAIPIFFSPELQNRPRRPIFPTFWVLSASFAVSLWALRAGAHKILRPLGLQFFGFAGK
jgi:hypothetical protein